MTAYITIVFFIYGLFFGSFFNLVGDRLPLGKSIVKPRSSCPKCNYILKWYDLIPIFSYIFLGGKCRKCSSEISLFHPFMELLTGILFATSYYFFGISYELIIALALCSMFVIVIVSDLNYLIIPDEIIIFFGALITFINVLNLGIVNGLLQLGYGIILFIIMYLIMLFGNFLFKKESLGGGDIKLMFVLGMILSLPNSIFSIFISSCIALPVSLIIYLKNKDNIIPFGPFLILGTLLLYFSKVNVLEVLKMLYQI